MILATPTTQLQNSPETRSALTSQALYARENPCPAKLLVRQKLSLPGSEKETFHYELAINSLYYEPGDSLAVFPTNPPELVEQLLRLLRFSGEEMVENPAGELIPIRIALLRDYAITRLSRKLVSVCAERVSSSRFLDERNMRDRHASLDAFIWGRDLVDFFNEFPEARTRFSPAELVSLLAKLQPRLYSVASSQKLYPDRAHLLVTNVSHEFRGRIRKGVCTSFLAERADERSPIPVFFHSAKHFHLPDDPDVPIIMIGVGCGVAPYRGFMQERDVTGARGMSWLFFGEQREKTDFYYRDEWKMLLTRGALTRMDTAFSRDQAHKIYVQHRMLERAPELWAWFQDGAYFYVCGDAERMAPDVDAALHEVIKRAGGLSEEQAREYVETLRSEKRYRRDVY